MTKVDEKSTVVLLRGWYTLAPILILVAGMVTSHVTISVEAAETQRRVQALEEVIDSRHETLHRIDKSVAELVVLMKEVSKRLEKVEAWRDGRPK